MTAVYHGIDEVNWFRSNGYENVPTPIETYYEWPLVKSKFEAFEHQKITAGFITLNKKCFIFSEMGTGKTESILYAIDNLMKEGKVKRALLVSPLSTLTKVWADALFHTFYWRTFAVLHGTAAKRKELLSQDTNFFIINYDGLKVIKDDLLRRPDINMIAYDEASCLRTGDTKLYEAVKTLALPDTRLVLATATPTPNGPEGAWSLAKLVNPEGVPRYFGAWRRSTMNQISPFKWQPKKESFELVNRALQPAILFRRDECLDLPENTIQRRECELSPEQMRLFKDMRKEMALEMQSSITINAVNAADKMTKLLQIASGSIKNAETEDYHDIECSSRIKALLEVIEESTKKVIVFCDYTGPLRMIVKELKKNKINAAFVDGSVGQNERNEIFDRFETGTDLKVLVANSRTVSHGLTLVSATTAVWWVATHSLERFTQANMRINRPGQTHKTTTVLLGSTQLEWQIFDKLEERNENMNNALDLYKSFVESKL